MKTKNHDELDDSPSIFAGAACRRHHPFSKTNPFADISYYGWNDGGMGRFCIARHGSAATAMKQTQPTDSPLKGSINFGFSDGHVELVKLPRLWLFNWHKG